MIAANGKEHANHHQNAVASRSAATGEIHPTDSATCVQKRRNITDDRSAHRGVHRSHSPHVTSPPHGPVCAPAAAKAIQTQTATQRRREYTNQIGPRRPSDYSAFTRYTAPVNAAKPHQPEPAFDLLPPIAQLPFRPPLTRAGPSFATVARRVMQPQDGQFC